MKPDPASRTGQRGAASTWVFTGFAAVALFFLLTEHRAHLFGWLPFLLVAACPLMHLFHRHGGHGRHGIDSAGARSEKATTPPGVSSDPNDPAAPAARHH